MLDTDFAFHWEGGGSDFRHLHVVSFEIEDAMSAPFEARLLLLTRDDGDDIDPCDLVGKLATLRIATGATPAFRAFHGLIVSAEDRGSSAHGRLYELTLMPPFARAMHRQRSRIFLEKTTRQIVEAVVLGDPKVQAGDASAGAPDDLRASFETPQAKFAWRLSSTARLDDAKLRPYCVQYEESDFDFVARLLEEEGISYHFEHTESQIVFVASDADGGRAKLEPFDPLAPDVASRHLDALRSGARMRPTKVKLLEYNWQNPKLDMGAEAKGDSDDLFVQAYPGRFVEAPDKGSAMATAILERYQSEARHATASGSCRLLGAGTVFPYQHGLTRLEGEYLVTKARLRGRVSGELAPGERLGTEIPGTGPFHVEVELARRGSGQSASESKWRPPRRTRKPHIGGMQTATVMDEPSARGVEIHVGGPDGNANGCVRLKFPWDTDDDRLAKEPGSKWVRVSQIFAGAGGGSVAHPRVGTEVIVSYEDGDPDRPIVVGRVYNGIQPAAASGQGAATVTTMKSLSSPGGGCSNEFQFDDTAGSEAINLSAGNDWNSVVGNDRTESVANNSTSSVDVNRTESTGADRSTTVGGSNTEGVCWKRDPGPSPGNRGVNVGGDHTTAIGGSAKLSIGGTNTVGVAGAEGITIGGAQTISVGGAQTVGVAAAQTTNIGAAQTISIGAAKTETIGAWRAR